MTKKMNKKETVEKLEKQIEQATEALNHEVKSKTRYKTQVENWRELTTLKIEGVEKGLINPEYPHHTNPRFWELQANEMKFKKEEEEEQQDGLLAQYDFKIEAFEKELMTLESELQKLGGSQK